jgi:hypothetical protein
MFQGLFGDSALCHLVAPLQQASRLGKILWIALVWTKSGLHAMYYGYGRIKNISHPF